VTLGLVPPTRPGATRDMVLAYCGAEPLPPFPFLVGRRGYYGDTMGKPGVNDIGLYDDALWLVERDRLTAFNANCDPTRTQRGMARLCVGRWKYRPGIHGLSRPVTERYEALVQAGHVTVDRDGIGKDTGFFGINIHRGGETTTSSLGCQTIPKAQWGDKWGADPSRFMALIHRALAEEGRDHPGRDTLVYILTSRY
jgi:hypothetical protein